SYEFDTWMVIAAPTGRQHAVVDTLNSRSARAVLLLVSVGCASVGGALLHLLHRAVDLLLRLLHRLLALLQFLLLDRGAGGRGGGDIEATASKHGGCGKCD